MAGLLIRYSLTLLGALHAVCTLGLGWSAVACIRYAQQSRACTFVHVVSLACRRSHSQSAWWSDADDSLHDGIWIVYLPTENHLFDGTVYLCSNRNRNATWLVAKKPESMKLR